MASQSLRSSEDLSKELERLKEKAGLGFELEVYRLPGFKKYSKEGKELKGEVQGNKIFLYDEDFEEAKETLLHEFIEYLVGQAIDPYRRLVNALVSLFEDQAYSQREKIIKALAKILLNKTST